MNRASPSYTKGRNWTLVSLEIVLFAITLTCYDMTAAAVKAALCNLSECFESIVTGNGCLVLGNFCETSLLPLQNCFNKQK